MESYLGTCSWKYNSWKGIVYPEKGKFNYLREYSKHFNTVEIDQWFWSLFGEGSVKMPESKTVKEYLASVPEDFKFTIKVPNSITLTHFYKPRIKNADIPLRPNMHFMSTDLFQDFLNSISPLSGNIGAILFQYEYLNKKKMESSEKFFSNLELFFKNVPRNFIYGIETRNPNYLNRNYFKFLNSLKIFPVLIQGYYMPDIVDLYRQNRDLIKEAVIIRLIGPDRRKIEEKSGGKWDKIVSPKDDELENISSMVADMKSRGMKVYINVNNHYEGSAPLTIKKLRELLEKKS